MAITFPTSGTTGLIQGDSSVTSGAFSPGANTLLVAYIWVGSDAAITVGNSGISRTWTKRAEFNGPSDAGGEVVECLYIYTAPNPTAQSSITVSVTCADEQAYIAVKPQAAAGTDLNAPVGDTHVEFYESAANSFSRNTIVSTVNNSRSICAATSFSDPNGIGSTDGVVTSFQDFSEWDSSHIALNKSSSTATSGTTVPFSFIGSTNPLIWGIVAVELLPGSVTQTVTPLAISSAEAFGTNRIDLSAPVTGITSEEAFGTVQINHSLTPTAIDSEEAFGTPILGGVAPEGIASGEEFGLPTVNYDQELTVTGIPSGEAVGTPEDVYLGHPQDLLPEVIESLERVMEPVVRLAKKISLRPPTIQETPAGPGIFFSRYGIHRGISIIKRQDGSYYTTRFPAQTELEEVAKYYLGGYVWPLTVEEMQDLTAAGYGQYITLDDNDT